MLTIYKASAGSGKTYNLALEYVKLVLGSKNAYGRYELSKDAFNRHRHVLAVTFTNKATSEMKDRIIGMLATLSHMPVPGVEEPKYVETLMNEFGCRRSDLAHAAAAALDQLLNDYTNFNVSTIDSFFQTVLRTFAREVDRRGDYEVELNDAYAIDTGIGMMLDDINYGHPANLSRMVGWISDYAHEQINKKKAFNVFNRSSHLLRALGTHVEAITKEGFKQHSVELVRYLADDSGLVQFTQCLRKCIDGNKERCSSIAGEALNEFDALGFDPRALNASLRKYIGYFAAAEEFKLSDMLKLKTVDKLVNEGDTDVAWVKKYLPKSGKNYVMPPESVAMGIADALGECIRLDKETRQLQCLINAAVGMEFIGFTIRYIEQWRKENNIILLSDTNQLIKRIINGSEMPFVYERLGVILTHFLIDEFQDTSRLQWENLRPLLANSLAQGADSLIIGDEKQSIYRFRNSDSELLHSQVANEDFPDRHRLRGVLPSDNSNYRTSHLVVRFNNTVFSRVGKTPGLDIYDNAVQSLPDKTAGMTGRVTVTKTDDSTEAYRRLADRIIEQHNAGYRWRDIAVLVRRAKEGAEIISYLLENHPEIPFASGESLYLSGSPAVRQILSMLKLVEASYADSGESAADSSGTDTADKAVQYGDMADTLMMISRYEYHRGRLADDRTPDDCASAALACALDTGATAQSKLRDEVMEIRRANPVNLVALVEAIIDTRISEAQRVREGAYLAAFVDAVMRFSAIYNPSIGAFMQWWEENGDNLSVDASPDDDAVSILTIHKAKGLEWPCVHVPRATWSLCKVNDPIWVSLKGFDPEIVPPKCCPPAIYITPTNDVMLAPGVVSDQIKADHAAQRLDSINLAYVAFTRAGRELDVTLGCKGELSKLIEEAIKAPLISTGDEDFDKLLLDTAAAVDADGNFSVGVPTEPERKNDSNGRVREIVCPVYNVIHRPDTEQIASVEDATSLRATYDLGNEEVKSPVDEPDAGSDTDIEVFKARTRRGTLLHAVLAHLDRFAELDHLFAMRMRRRDVDREEYEEMRRTLAEAFEKVPQWRDRWFVTHKRALTEQSVYDAMKDVTSRPDRVVMTADGTVDVVDYKFTSAELPEHVAQVKSYVNLLRQMGHPRVRGFLWYPERAHVIEVD